MVGLKYRLHTWSVDVSTDWIWVGLVKIRFLTQSDYDKSDKGLDESVSI
ncbi:unnamed protein product [Camellia sinensis]